MESLSSESDSIDMVSFKIILTALLTLAQKHSNHNQQSSASTKKQP